MEFHNGYQGITEKYAYDANGNLDKDISKKISKFYYNYLNLCRGILFQSNDRIEYLYDASGVKQLEKHIGYTTGTTVVKDYIDNKVYENGVLKRVLTDEGYLEKVGNDYAYYFFLKDYLGSNRMVLNSTGGIVQATNYYAFGLSYAESPARTDQQVQPYKFGGKELDRMYGLDAYDFGARMYNPSVGRFMTMDPLAEKYYSVSPYAYCLNNPVNAIDPDGREVWILFDETVNGKTSQQRVQYKEGKLYGTNGKEYNGGNEYATKVLNDLNKLSNANDVLKNRINDLVGSKNIHTVEMTASSNDGNSNTPLSQSNDEKGISTGSKTKYNPDNGENVRGDKREARVGLSHELLGHGWDSDKGKTDYNKTDNGIPMYEVNAVNIENRARASTGNEKKTTYGGKPVPAKLLHDTHKK